MYNMSIIPVDVDQFFVINVFKISIASCKYGNVNDQIAILIKYEEDVFIPVEVFNIVGLSRFIFHGGVIKKIVDRILNMQKLTEIIIYSPNKFFMSYSILKLPLLKNCDVCSRCAIFWFFNSKNIISDSLQKSLETFNQENKKD